MAKKTKQTTLEFGGGFIGRPMFPAAAAEENADPSLEAEGKCIFNVKTLLETLWAFSVGWIKILCILRAHS